MMTHGSNHDDGLIESSRHHVPQKRALRKIDWQEFLPWNNRGAESNCISKIKWGPPTVEVGNVAAIRGGGGLAYVSG